MSEMWEREATPWQAEVHEPLTEFDGPIGVTPPGYDDPEKCPVCGQPDNCGDCDHTPVDELGDCEYIVTISTRMSVGIATEDEIRRAIYRGVEIIDSEDAVRVQRA